MALIFLSSKEGTSYPMVRFMSPACQDNSFALSACGHPDPSSWPRIKKGSGHIVPVTVWSCFSGML